MHSDISCNKTYNIIKRLSETDKFSDDESDTCSTDSCISEGGDNERGVVIEASCLSEDENEYDDWEEVNLNDVIINTMQNQNYFKDKKV